MATWSQYTTTGVSPTITVSGVDRTTAPLNNNDFTGRVNGSVSYIWNQTGTADWTVPSNWGPVRVSPQPNDVLIFDNGSTTTATNVPSQIIGKLILINNTNLSLQSAAPAQTLTISGGTGPDLNITSGSTLQLSSTGANQIGIDFNPATQDALIDGSLIINANGASSNSFNTTNSNTIASGTIRNNGGVFTSSALNLTFNSSATYIHSCDASNIPVATWDPASNLNISGLTSAAPSGLAQTFGNVNYSSSFTCPLAAPMPVAGNLDISAGTIDVGSQTITLFGNLTGTGGLSLTTGTLNIAGNFTNSGTFTYGTTSTVDYNGAVAQQVRGTSYGNLTISGGSTKTLLNPATVNGTLNLTSGVLQLGAHNLTLANTTAIGGSPFGITNMIETNGNGRFIRSANATNDSFNLTYPLGSGGFYNPLIITGLPVTGTGARILSVRAVPANLGILVNSLNKYWDLTQTNITTDASSLLSFGYNAGEVFARSQV